MATAKQQGQPFTVRLPLALYKALVKKAETDRRTINATVTIAVEKLVARP